ncbi:MAG: YigZ family protein [Clostridiales bacterium]|nr:YigZ family protein [Clostridiales bacterium]
MYKLRGKTWNTVGSSARIEYEVKKSVFIADVAPVATGQEATDFLRRIKKEFPDARHHVYAYRVGDETLEQRYSDDGEPSGTAGMPVLDVLLHQELDNVICVVTRYFGGILLGTGGLTRAYSTAASMGIEAAGPCKMAVLELFHVGLDYSVSEKFQYAAKKNGFSLGDIIYEATPVIPVYCPKDEKEKLITLVNDITAGRGSITHIGSSATRISE